MSVQPTDTSTPASYSYPSSLSATDLDVGKSATASNPAKTSGTDSYESQYNSFLAYNDQELIANSVASPTTSAQSTESVLEQAAADQQAGWTVASSSTAATTPATTSTTSSALDDADVTNLPTFDSIINASDTTANAYIDNLVQNYGGTGTTGNTVDTSA